MLHHRHRAQLAQLHIRNGNVPMNIFTNPLSPLSIASSSPLSMSSIYSARDSVVRPPSPVASIDAPLVCTSSSSANSSNSDDSSALPPEIEIWTADDVLFHGLKFVGFDGVDQSSVGFARNMTRFGEHFGAYPDTLAALFKDIRDRNDVVNYKELMMGVNWAKCRNRRSEMTARWRVCEERVYGIIFKSLELIQQMKPYKIRFEFSESPRMIKGSIDCCNYTVNEFRDVPSAQHYDHKSASCGIVSTKLLMIA